MKRILLLILLLSGTLAVYGQYPRSMRIRHLDERTLYFDPAYPYGFPSKMLSVRHGAYGRIYMNGLPIPLSYATMLMAEQPQAYAAVRRANSNLNWSIAAASAGTVGICWTLVDWASRPSDEFKGDPFFDKHRGRSSVRWEPAVVGALLWLAVIPLVRGYNRQLDRSVALYNRGMDFSLDVRPPTPYLAPAETGIGLALKF